MLFNSIYMACILAFALTPSCAWSETLNDKDIRAMETEDDGKGNPQKALQNMQKRMDDSFVIDYEITRVVDNNPPVISHKTYKKNEMIENAKQNYSVLKKVEENKTNVVSITYSFDKKLAYVTSEEKVALIANLLLRNGKYGSVKVEGGTTCTRTLTLKNDIIRILRTECKYHSHLITPQGIGIQ